MLICSDFCLREFLYARIYFNFNFAFVSQYGNVVELQALYSWLLVVFVRRVVLIGMLCFRAWERWSGGAGGCLSSFRSSGLFVGCSFRGVFVLRSFPGSSVPIRPALKSRSMASACFLRY